MRLLPSFLKPAPLPAEPESFQNLAARAARVAAASSPPPAPVETVVDPLAVIGKRNEDLRQGVETLLVRLQEMELFRTQFQSLVGGVAGVIQELETTKSKLGEVQGSLNAERESAGDARRHIAELTAELERLDSDHRIVSSERDRLESLIQHVESVAEETSLALREKEISLADFERQLNGETERHRQTTAENEARREEVERLGNLLSIHENDLAALRDRAGLLDDETRSLKTALEDSQGSVLRLGRRITELEPIIQRLREQNAQLETTLHAERETNDRTRAQSSEEIERLRADMNTMQVKLEAVSSRADANERFLGEARRQLRDKLEELRVSERKTIDGSLQVNTLQKRLEAAEREILQATLKAEEVEKSRKLILERSEALAKSARGKDIALQKTEQKIQFLTERLEDWANRARKEREQYEFRLGELTEQLEKEKTERAIAEGALQSARRERLNLQRELLNVKAGVREDKMIETEQENVREDIESMTDFDDNVKRFNATP